MPGSQGCLLPQPGLSWRLPAIRLRCDTMSRLHAIRAGCAAPAASQKAPPQQERRQRDSSVGPLPGWASFGKGTGEAAPDRWSDRRAAAGRVQAPGLSAPGLSRWSTDNAVRQAAAGRTVLAPRRADAEAAPGRDRAGATVEPDLWGARRGSPYSSVAPGGVTEQGASHHGRPALPGWLQQVPLDGLHKPVGLVLASAYVLATACHLSGETPASGRASADRRLCWCDEDDSKGPCSVKSASGTACSEQAAALPAIPHGRAAHAMTLSRAAPTLTRLGLAQTWHTWASLVPALSTARHQLVSPLPLQGLQSGRHGCPPCWALAWGFCSPV